jgi:DNA-binding MarR family transcriptional regulator
MELSHLRYFVAAAEELHFGRAAERMHIVQPALSKQIVGLERELDVELLHRTKRHVRLTEAGKAFYAEARAILERTERAAEFARSAAERASAGDRCAESRGADPGRQDEYFVPTQASTSPGTRPTGRATTGAANRRARTRSASHRRRGRPLGRVRARRRLERRSAIRPLPAGALAPRAGDRAKVHARRQGSGRARLHLRWSSRCSRIDVAAT